MLEISLARASFYLSPLCMDVPVSLGTCLCVCVHVCFGVCVLTEVQMHGHTGACEAHAYVHVRVGGQVHLFACTDVLSCLSCLQTDLLPIKHADVLANQQNRRQKFYPPHQS